MTYRPWLIGTLFVVLFGISCWMFLRQYTKNTKLIVADTVSQLAAIFEEIDRTAGILNFEHQANFIDFLNVGSFVGSEVGSLNLKNAAGWKGPYLKDNPTLQEKYYQVVVTKQGFFVVPGPGVKLGNGKVIGTDIVFDAETDMQAFLKPGSDLYAQGKPLVAKINRGSQAQEQEEEDTDKADSVDAQLMRDRLKNM